MASETAEAPPAAPPVVVVAAPPPPAAVVWPVVVGRSMAGAMKLLPFCSSARLVAHSPACQVGGEGGCQAFSPGSGGCGAEPARGSTKLLYTRRPWITRHTQQTRCSGIQEACLPHRPGPPPAPRRAAVSPQWEPAVPFL